MEHTNVVQITAASFSNDTDRVQKALEAAGIGTWEVQLDTNVVAWDDLCRELFGLGKTATVTYNEAITYIHPDDLEAVKGAVRNALAGKEDGKYDMRYRTIGAEDGKLRWVHFTGQAKFNGAGEAVFFGGIAREITGVMKTEQHLGETVSLLQTVLDSSFAGVSVLATVRNAEGAIVDFEYRLVNTKTAQLNERTDLVGKLFSSIHPGVSDTNLFDDFVAVVESGQPIEKKRHYKIEGGEHWYTTLAVKLGDGLVFSFHDITESVVAQQQLEASEERIRSVIEAAPAGMGLFVGRDLVVEIPNKAFTEIVGKGPGIAGKPLREVMPELDNQPFLQILDNVYTSGKMFQSFGTQVKIVQNGVMTAHYYNISYTPLYDSNGEVYAILDIAIDVTEQIIARQRLEESESKLRSLIAAAPAAIGVFTGRDLIIETFNQTFIEIAGKGPDIGGKPLREVLPELESQAFLQILEVTHPKGYGNCIKGVIFERQIFRITVQ
jgi:PAS domain S-box-containing protein